MKENQSNNRESPNSEGKRYKRLDVKDLKRDGIHSQKEKKQSNLYPSKELAEDLENCTSNSDESSLNNSSDISPEKPELRYRPGGKGNNSIDCNQKSSKANKDKSETKQSNLIWVIIAGIIATLALFLLWSYPNKPINIEILMNDIKIKYNTQSDLTFRIVKSAIKTAAFKDSAPGILVLLASTEAKHLREQLALDIANAVSKSYVSIKYDSLKSPAELKRDIDVAIERNLSNNELKAVVVEDLDRLPFEAAMIFHSYCDHENAPFKKALYIMTLSSNETILPSLKSKELDTLATHRLNFVWENSGEDQVFSLLSRLTGSVAGVTA